MAPRLDAQAQKNTNYAILHVDIKSWGSPVATQFHIQSIPLLQVYDASGKLVAEGKKAYKYVK